MFSEHSRIKLEMKSKIYHEKHKIFGKWTILLSNQWIKKKSKGNYYFTLKDKNVMYKNLWEVAKALLREEKDTFKCLY